MATAKKKGVGPPRGLRTLIGVCTLIFLASIAVILGVTNREGQKDLRKDTCSGNNPEACARVCGNLGGVVVARRPTGVICAFLDRRVREFPGGDAAPSPGSELPRGLGLTAGLAPATTAEAAPATVASPSPTFLFLPGALNSASETRPSPFASGSTSILPR